MTQSPIVPRWAKRALAALVLAAALATPLVAQSARSMTSQTAQVTQTTHGALAVAPKPVCPGGMLFC
jgi:hypothetical protein